MDNDENWCQILYNLLQFCPIYRIQERIRTLSKLLIQFNWVNHNCTQTANYAKKMFEILSNARMNDQKQLELEKTNAIQSNAHLFSLKIIDETNEDDSSHLEMLQKLTINTSQ